MPEQKKATVNGSAPRATGHICMICGFIPSTKNKYRELQDHLVRKHFNDRIKAALPTKRPYMCPEPSCTIEGKDWQALMRHFTGKHGVLERYLREIIDAGMDEPADPKLRKVSTKSRLNPNGTAPAIQLPPEQIEQMERQALAVSAEERMILHGGDGSLATVLQTAVAPPLPSHKIQAGHKLPRRKRPSRNSTGSISSPESLQDEDDGSGVALGMSGMDHNNANGSGDGGTMLFHDQPMISELEEKEQPQLALVFKRPKSDPNGEDAYAFIDLQSFLASTTYIRNPADLVAKAANENVRLGVLATPLSPPPEQDELEMTKTESENDVKPNLITSQPETPQQQQQQVQSNGQADDSRVVFSSQQQPKQFQPPLPPPITSPPTAVGGTSAHLPPVTVTSSTATAHAMEQVSAAVASSAAGGQVVSSSTPILQQDQQQQQQAVDQPQTITVFNSVPVVDQAQPQFQDLQLDQHHQIVIPPTQEIPPHVEQQMLQAVQQQQQQTYVIQQAVDLEQSQHATLAAPGGTVLYTQQQMPLAATEQFSLAGNETIVISQEQLEQMLGPVYLDNQTVQVFNPSTVQLPTEPVQIQDIQQVEGAMSSTNIGLQQEPPLQPQQQVHDQGGQRVVVEQVGSLPIEASTSTSEQTDRPSREVQDSSAKEDSSAANATVAPNKVDNLQDVKEIDFSMF